MKKIVLSVLLAGTLSMAGDEVRGIEFDSQKVTIDEIKEITKNYFKTDYDYLDEKQKEELLQRVIEMKIVLAEAKDLGLDKSKKYIETIDTLKNMVLMDNYSELIFNSFEVEDRDLEKYYLENKSQFGEKDLRNASHVLLKSSEEAAEVIARLKKSKDVLADFKEIAEESSVGPSAKNGGNLGWFGKGQMVPEFEKVVFSLKKGEFTSEPIKTQFGYHVILLNDKKTTPGISLEEFSENLKANEAELKKFKYELFKVKMADNVRDLRDTKHRIKIIK